MGAAEDGRARAPESASGRRGESPLQANAVRPVTECNCDEVMRRMRENRLSGSEGGGMKPIISPYPYRQKRFRVLGDRGSIRRGRPRTDALRQKRFRV
jgi:hypothetical protein